MAVEPPGASALFCQRRQFPPDQLAGFSSGQGLDDSHQYGRKIVREPFADVLRQTGGIDRAVHGYAQQRYVAKYASRVGNTDAATFQDVVDFFGVSFEFIGKELRAAAIDDFIRASREMHVAIFVDPAKVAAIQPPRFPIQNGGG
jgi:hypothetical protein